MGTVASTPTEMRDFIETYVGPMVLKTDGEIERKESAPGSEADVKRSLAGARQAITPRPDEGLVLAFTWGPEGMVDAAC